MGLNKLKSIQQLILYLNSIVNVFFFFDCQIDTFNISVCMYCSLNFIIKLL